MRIAHYMQGMQLPGGVRSYLRRIGALLRDAGHDVIYLDVAEAGLGGPGYRDDITYVEGELNVPAAAHRAGADVLHTHILLPFVSPPPLPIVRTIHNHDAYCPSGSRFLAKPGRPCDRTYGVCACAWGHLVNRCGSVRPAAMLREFKRTGDELRHTRQLRVLTVSEFVRTQMLRAGYDAALVRALALPAPPPPRPAQTMSRVGIPRFVFLGRLTPEKGVDWLLKAVRGMKQEVAIDIAGSGNLRRENEYRALAATLGITSRVTFHPWLEKPAVDSLLANARALVFPSVWHEPAGLVALEAMACGRAVIAGRVGGIPEIVADDTSGLLVEPANVRALAEGIDRLAANPGLAESMGAAGRGIAVEHFSAAAHLEVLLHTYRTEVDLFAANRGYTTWGIA